jgi:ubiquitin-protein ligase
VNISGQILGDIARSHGGDTWSPAATMLHLCHDIHHLMLHMPTTWHPLNTNPDNRSHVDDAGKRRGSAWNIECNQRARAWTKAFAAPIGL